MRHNHNEIVKCIVRQVFKINFLTNKLQCSNCSTAPCQNTCSGKCSTFLYQILLQKKKELTYRSYEHFFLFTLSFGLLLYWGCFDHCPSYASVVRNTRYLTIRCPCYIFPTYYSNSEMLASLHYLLEQQIWF